jgi:hypothetical protein
MEMKVRWLTYSLYLSSSVLCLELASMYTRRTVETDRLENAQISPASM